MSSAALPEVIERYQRAHDEHDDDATLATFSTTALVVDDGHSARGHDEILEWLTTTASEYTWERTLLAASSSGPGQWLLEQHITGDFPGGTVDLHYRFTVVGDLIEELVIAP